MTAAACLKMLATCRLNRYEPNDLLKRDYSITQPTQEQTAILRRSRQEETTKDNMHRISAAPFLYV
jgi:hypothetical protein